MREEPCEELRDPGLRHLGEQIGQLGERGAPVRQALERALDTERHLLEAIERQTLERLAGGVPRLRLVAAEDVHQQVHDPRPLHLAEQRRRAAQAQGGLVLVDLVEHQRLADGALEQRQEDFRIGVDELVVCRHDGTFGIEERIQRGGRIPHGAEHSWECDAVTGTMKM